MPNLKELPKGTLTAIQGVAKENSESSSTICAAAQRLTDEVFNALDGSAVLARFYVTERYGDLPDAVRQFALDIAQKRGVGHELRDGTPVLALAGTTGKEIAWCDRNRSQRHLAIPLTSSSLVDAIPMVAALLQQMGVGIDWLDKEDPYVDVSTNRLGGNFYVRDASQATDLQGRKLIPAAEFVMKYDVRTVFGLGNAYADGRIGVLIVFCRDIVPEDAVSRLQPTVDVFVASTTDKKLY